MASESSSERVAVQGVPVIRLHILDFAPLHLDYSVGADDWASRSTLRMGAQQGAVAFATTHWSVVLEAQSQSPAARDIYQ
jgi:hypothetical protein